jgi:hypothetical protein
MLDGGGALKTVFRPKNLEITTEGTVQRRTSWFVLFTKYYWMMGEVSKAHNILGGNPKGRYCLEDLRIGRMIILEGIFKKLLIVYMTQDKDMMRI